MREENHVVPIVSGGEKEREQVVFPHLAADGEMRFIDWFRQAGPVRVGSVGTPAARPTPSLVAIRDRHSSRCLPNRAKHVVGARENGKDAFSVSRVVSTARESLSFPR